MKIFTITRSLCICFILFTICCDLQAKHSYVIYPAFGDTLVRDTTHKPGRAEATTSLVLGPVSLVASPIVTYLAGGTNVFNADVLPFVLLALGGLMGIFAAVAGSIALRKSKRVPEGKIGDNTMTEAQNKTRRRALTGIIFGIGGAILTAIVWTILVLAFV